MSTELSSAPVPSIGDGDHVRGEGSEAILYLDLACPHCAAVWLATSRLSLRLCFRHFPLAGKRPRSPALHAAVEAAAAQREDAFWGLVDSIYADQGHLDDPHLWQRATDLGLDLGRFERDRRSEHLALLIRRDFESGIRAGITATPTAFAAGKRIDGDLPLQLARLRHL